MGQLLFRCPKTGKDFDSDLHEVKFTDAKVEDKTAPPRR
jgi:hypothetical protein